MLLYILGYLVIPLEVICCKIFFHIFCTDKRNKVCYKILFWILLCMLLYIPAILISESFLLKQIILIGIVTVASKFYWRISWKKSLALTFIYQSLVVLADYVVIVMESSLLVESASQDLNRYVYLVLLTKIILFSLVIIIKHLFGKNQLELLDDATWLKFMFFPFFTICIIVALIYKPELLMSELQKQIFWILVFGLVAMNIMLFYLLQDVAKRERELFELRLVEQEAKHNFTMYKSISEATKQQQALSHEYQNYLVCIQTLLHEKQYNKAEEFLTEITGTILKNLDYIDTNHIIVNTILNEKYVQAIEQDIVMVCKINNLEKIKITDQDITLLLSNLLNNAIEACQKCNDKKVIKVKFVVEDDNVVLSVRNTYDGQVITSGENYLTTKQDKKHHGMGLKNILQVIEKYNGFYSIDCDEQFFSFSCIIPREPHQK